MEEPKYFHVMPEEGTDVKEHEESPTCWCRPVMEKIVKNDNEVWVHNKFNLDD